MDPVYVSTVTIERLGGPLRRAHIPGNEDPTLYSVHGAIAEHYGVKAGSVPTHATTIDHVVAAAAG